MAKDEQGVFPDIDISAYHSETLWKTPSLSASVGKPLVQGRAFSETPLHVWNNHPRLNKNAKRTNKVAFDLGNAAHKQAVGRGHSIVKVPFDNYAKKEAQQLRDEAYELGCVPLLNPQWEQIHEMSVVRDRMLHNCPWGHPFTNGQAEVALRWKEKTRYGDVWCKALVDYLYDERPIQRGVDYKSTGQTAHPGWWERRQMTSLGMDIQAAFHCRGYKALGLAHSVDYLWVVQEWNPPYACSLIGYSDAELEASQRDVQQMIDTWAGCLYTGNWYGYDMAPYMARRPYSLGSHHFD